MGQYGVNFISDMFVDIIKVLFYSDLPQTTKLSTKLSTTYANVRTRAFLARFGHFAHIM